MEQSEKQSFSPGVTAKRARSRTVRPEEGTGGRWTSLEALRATSGGSRKSGSGLVSPGLPESPQLALPASPSRSRPRRQCQQLPSRPECRRETADRRALREDSEPTCQVAGWGRICPPATFRQRPSPSPTPPIIAATSSAATPGTQRGMGGGCYGECLGTNGFIRTRSIPERRGGALLRGIVAPP